MERHRLHQIKTGDRFGFLTVLSQDSVIGKHKKWTCKCDCGNIFEVFETNLIQKRTTKCWQCSHTIKRNMYKRNKSGYTGISFDKNNNKWQASIGYNGKLIFLGRFATIEEALETRNNYIKENNLNLKIQNHN